ncbi:MAG: sugar nucleotide-binding protein [Thermoleophilaceae bacterium]
MTAARTRLLILGGTGMLGHEAVRVLAPDFEVHATVRDAGLAARHGLPAHELHEFDAWRPERLPDILTATGADAVLNCIGVVKQLDDASRPVPSITLNALLPHQLAEACGNAGARLVHVSTDCVFSGELPAPRRYAEDDVPDPRDLYGRSKLLGEVHDGALTLRTSIIGWELERASGLLEWLASERGKRVRGFANALFSGLTTRALARGGGASARWCASIRG